MQRYAKNFFLAGVKGVIPLVLIRQRPIYGLNAVAEGLAINPLHDLHHLLAGQCFLTPFYAMLAKEPEAAALCCMLPYFSTLGYLASPGGRRLPCAALCVRHLSGERSLSGLRSGYLTLPITCDRLRSSGPAQSTWENLQRSTAVQLRVP